MRWHTPRAEREAWLRERSRFDQVYGPVLQRQEAARRVGVTADTLAVWRRRGAGPLAVVRPGGCHHVYPVSALEEWMRAHPPRGPRSDKPRSEEARRKHREKMRAWRARRLPGARQCREWEDARRIEEELGGPQGRLRSTLDWVICVS